MLSSLLRNRAWSKYVLRCSFSTSSGRPPWLKEECIQLQEKLQLKQPESSEKLLEVFLDSSSYKLLSKEKDEASEYLKTKIGDAEEGEKIGKVCNFLIQPFDPKFLTTNTIQARFGEGKFQFFWNIHILQAYANAIKSNSKNHYLTGPKNFGKSFNFAFFRNILYSNVSESRVIYIHNPADLYADKYPFQWILGELQFTFAYELMLGDQEVIAAFDDCYKCLEKSVKTQEKKLENLLSIYPKRGKKLYLLIDQQNVVSKNSMRRARKLMDPDDIKEYRSARAIITKILPRGCYRLLQVASMTDEGFEYKDQEFIRTLLYDALPLEMARKWIQISSLNSLQPDEIDIILENSQRVPGEVTKILGAKGGTTDEKVQDYFNQRVTEIKSDFGDFEFKKKNGGFGEDAKKTMSMLSAYIDTKFRTPVPVTEQYYDMRYIYMKNDVVRSLFPAVRKAMISRYSPRNELLVLMEKMHAIEQMGSFGSVYDTYIVDTFRRVDQQNPIRMALTGGEECAKELRKFEFNSPLKEISLETIEKINLKKLTSDTMLVPISKNFEGVDLMIYLPGKKVLLVIQLKYKCSLFHQWKSFCRGEGGDQPLKDYLASHCKNQMSDLQIKFVFGFLLNERGDDVETKVSKSLGRDIYCWHTNEIPGLGLLKLEEKIKKSQEIIN